MTDAGEPPTCDAEDDGCQTFYYTNQQSARLMFYHDHAWGITRLNVYAGEAAGYLIADATEKKLDRRRDASPAAADTLPLIIQDGPSCPVERRTQLRTQAGPDLGRARWGGKGNLWYHHVYMPAQNPGDASGMSAYGAGCTGRGSGHRPPARKYGPIAEPVLRRRPASSTTRRPGSTRPTRSASRELIPGTPNISAGMEQFNDTPLVNGDAYPKITVDPKPYRLRMLNAANDRFFNLQWYVADPHQGDGTTEVALNPAELAAAQTDPNVSPTPADAHNDAAGPDWVQIGNEGGFLPAPTVIDGQQPTTWITDPTRFDVGNVDQHSMLLAPAERADAVVDFSQVRRQDADPLQRRPGSLPGPRPRLRLLHRGPGPEPHRRADHLARVRAQHPHRHAGHHRRHHSGTGVQRDGAARTPSPTRPNGSGVFESGQHPPIVGQAAYNSA